MLYPFQSADGDLIEVDLPMTEAPEFGEERLVDGKVYRRIMSMPQIHGAVGNFPRFESSQLPKWWRHHKGEFSPDGKPRYTTRREIEEDMARARQSGTEISYGEL